MNKIKELRELKKETQEELGKILNVSKATISKYENGSVEVSNETLIKLANHFEVTTDYLLGIDDNNKLIQNIDKKMQDNDIVIAANSKVDLGKLAKADKKTARMINILLDDFLNDDDEEEE